MGPGVRRDHAASPDQQCIINVRWPSGPHQNLPQPNDRKPPQENAEYHPNKIVAIIRQLNLPFYITARFHKIASLFNAAPVY